MNMFLKQNFPVLEELCRTVTHSILLKCSLYLDIGSILLINTKEHFYTFRVFDLSIHYLARSWKLSIVTSVTYPC